MRPARHSPTRCAKASHIQFSAAAREGQGWAPLRTGAVPARRSGPARSVTRQAETSSALAGDARKGDLTRARKGDTPRALTGDTTSALTGAPLRPSRGDETRAPTGARIDESPR